MQLQFLECDDLAPYHRTTLAMIREILAARIDVGVAPVSAKKKFVPEKPAENYWLWARDWKSVVGQLKGCDRSRLFVSLLSSEKPGKALSNFWKGLIGPSSHKPLLLAHSVHNFTYYREFHASQSVSVGYLPLPIPTIKKTIKDSKHTMCVGSWTPFYQNQNIHFLLTIAHWLKTHKIDCEFMLFGEGPLQKHIHHLVMDMDLDDFVQVHQSSSINDIDALDIFLYTPERHSTFLPLLSAAALEKSIIASQVMGIEEYISHGENGFVLGAFQTEVFGKQIAELVASPSHQEQIGRAIKQKIEKTHSLSALARHYFELFDIEEPKLRTAL